MVAEREASIFFEEKKQKTLIKRIGTHIRPTADSNSKLTKFFCFFLFTKRSLSSLDPIGAMVSLLRLLDRT